MSLNHYTYITMVAFVCEPQGCPCKEISPYESTHTHRLIELGDFHSPQITALCALQDGLCRGLCSLGSLGRTELLGS